MALVERYAGFEEVFDSDELPVRAGRVQGYQLMRGTMAAQATGGAFCVLVLALSVEGTMALLQRRLDPLRVVRSR